MFTVLANTRNSNLYLTAALALVTVILFFAVIPAISAPEPVIIPVTNRSESVNDYFQRHPGMSLPAKNTVNSDFYRRHPAWTINTEIAVIPVTGNAESPDYAQRHPELSVPAAANLSDYFLRHPELSAPAIPTDTSDYFLRH